MGAPDLLRHLRCAGFTLALANGGGILVAPAGALTDEHRQAIRAHRGELLALLAGATAPLTPTGAAAPEALDLAAGAWTDADIARFLDRRARLMRWGWAEPNAENLAERLVKRDREHDDRVNCTDCRHYRPGRCGNHTAAGLQGPEVGNDLAAMLQRCPGCKP